MNVSTQPGSGVAGVTTVNAIGSRFPTDHGALLPSGITLTLSSACGGPAIATVGAQSVITVLGSQRRVGFVVPPSILAGTYFVSLAGKAADGASYASLDGSCSEVAVTHVSTAQTGCVASGTLSVNAPPKGGTVTAYAANGCWECIGDKYKGVQAVNVEGPTLSTSIATPDVVNSCATNSVTGQTVCAANGTDVYLLQDTSLITTLKSGSSGKSTIGGSPNNFGVVINPVANQAILGVGLDRNKTGVSTGLQVLNLGTNTFASPVPSRNKVSDEILIDPGRGFVLSPNDVGNYDIFSMKADGSGTEYSNQLPSSEDWDSAAEDCSTGIALAPSESSSGDIYIADLTQLQFDSLKNTWAAPSQLLPLHLDMQTIAIAPGASHLGILAPEYVNGGKFAVIQLPSTSGTGTPSIVDYVQGNVPGFLGTPDPHAITAYTSPNDGKAYGLIASSFPATDLARIDLACILAQPRTTQGHTVSAYPSSCIKIFATGNAAPAPPVFTSTPRATAAASIVYEDKVYVQASNNFPLLFNLPTAPAGLSIDPATGILHWVPSPSQVGSQTFTVRVTDVFGLTATAAFSISVFVNNNTPPVITSVPSTRSVVGALYTYQVTATDKNPASLRFSLSAEPTGMTLDPVSGLLQWTPSSGLGNQTANVTLQVIDANYLYASQSFQIALVPAVNHPPVIISNPVNTATVGQIFSYQVRASDPDNDPLAYSLISAPAGMTLDSATGLLQWTPVSSDVGDLSIGLRAKDPGALLATQTFSLHIQRAYPVPTIAITSPAPGALLSKPIDIVATISDPTASAPPILWTIDLLRGDNATQRLSSGSGAVSGATVAHLDPTLIRDDTYSVVITVSKNGQQDFKAFDYNVSSNNLKLGNFTTSFTDISIPVAGIPMVITRVYNSLDTSQGEFGAGWRLGLPGQVVDSARESPLEPFTANTRVYVTRPDGVREGFTFDPTQPSPLIPIFVPGFKSDAGVTDTLSVDPDDLANAGGVYYEFLGGPYNPSTYKLTTKYGVQYSIDEVAGLQQIKDRNDNTLTVTPDGIQSSSGLSLPIEHDGNGRITQITEPGGGYVRYAYDASGNLASSFDPLGNETKYYYENAQFPHYLTKITNPLGRPITRNVYNADGRLVAQCNATGDVTTLVGCTQFNPQVDLQVQTIVSSLGNRTDLYLDDQGNVQTERHWLDQTNHYDTVRIYDANSDLLSTTDPAGNTTKSTWDAAGNILTQTDSGGNTTRYTYSSSCNQPASITDALGHATTYAYDPVCNVRLVTDALGGVTEYRYDGQGNVTDFLDQVNNHWAWSYNAFGKPTQATDPGGHASQYGYYANGDTRYKIDRNGRRSDYQYNANHQLTTEVWRTNPQNTLTYSYDAAGELTGASDTDSRLAFAYTPDGHLQEADSVYSAGPSVSIQYGYDTDGNRTSVQDSTGGQLTYIYDPLARLVRVTQSGSGVSAKRVDYTFDASDSPTTQTRFADLAGNNRIATSSFKYQCGGCANRLTAVHTVSGDASLIDDLQLTRVSTGDIATALDADGVHAYQYDATGQLIAAQHSNSALQPVEFYKYDLAGNRTSSHLSGSYSFSYQSGGSGNRLLEDSGYLYGYDNEGNLVSKTSKADGSLVQYSYDYRNRLTQETTLNQLGGFSKSPFVYSYNPTDRRVMTKGSGATKFWLYDRLNPIVALSETGQVLTRNFYGLAPDEILADEVNGVTRWYSVDQVGSTRNLFANSGSILKHFTYDSFGRQLQPSPGLPEGDILFSSREFDSTGLGYFRTRYYEPMLGRFVEEDVFSPFAYNYASNNPLSHVDRNGASDSEDEYALLIKNVQRVVGRVGQAYTKACPAGSNFLTAAGVLLGTEAYQLRHHAPLEDNLENVAIAAFWICNPARIPIPRVPNDLLPPPL